jgi:hypothetical protein
LDLTSGIKADDTVCIERLDILGVTMAQIHINNKKPPHFDGTNYPYWKVKMLGHIKSINRKIWKVVETKIEIAKPEAPTATEEEMLQCNDIAVSALHDSFDERIFAQIKDLEMAYDIWKKLEESFEGTDAVKNAKAYILKEKFAGFKMNGDENVLEMFHYLQCLVNDLKAVGERVEGKDFSHKFLRCLPPRFGMLVTLLVRTGLNTMTPTQVLGDVMNDDTYRDYDVDGEKKKEDKDEKKKSVAFKASSSSKGKGKAKKEESSEEEEEGGDDDEEEEMALFVRRFNKFLKSKSSSNKSSKKNSKQDVANMKCFKCKKYGHLIAECPLNQDDNGDDEDDKKHKKDKKSKREEVHSQEEGQVICCHLG